VVASSLYDAVEALGERPVLARDIADIFAWDVDFARSVRPGDEFAALYERLYLETPSGEEIYARPGRVLAASYRQGDAEHRAVYFQWADGRGGYYRPDGSAVERQFLRAPLYYRRISSPYSPARFHPLLKVIRPHLGIDYAAPRGTPVWAVADGRVIYRARAGGFGKLIKLRHPNGYVSFDGHLSRYARGLHVGQRVQQKQVLGYVGSTGLATGPHLHFQLERWGRPVNPVLLRAPAGAPIPTDLRRRFAAVRDALLGELEPAPLVVTREAL